MKRATRILSSFMAAALILGCHENKDEQASSGGTPAPLAYAPAGGQSAPPDSAALRELTSPSSSGGGYAPASGGVDQGRALFDGARFSGASVVPVSDVIPAGRSRAAAAAVRNPLTAASSATPSRSAALPSRRRGDEPPLPDDPTQLKTAADAAGAAARGAGAVLLGFAADQIAQGYATIYPILSRAGWYAAHRRGEPVPMHPTRVTIHHTDGRQTMTEADTIAEVRSIQRFHMGPERGWDDIGYHFLIDGAGRVVEGRPAETLGAHVLSANEDNIGIAMMGDFDKLHPTAAQVESLTRLVSYLAVKYKQDPSARGFVQPHRHYGNTDCPGRNMMAIFERLRADIDGEARQILARQNAEPGRFQPVAVVEPVRA